MAFVDWAFRDRRTGRVVIAQWPNVPLTVWVVATAGRRLLGADGAGSTALRVVGTVALAWWAGDEIARGVNPWRRVLGGVVLAGVVVSLTR